MYEKKGQRLLTQREFASRVSRHVAAAFLLLLLTLWLGMAGYHWLEGIPWIDSFVDASMILGGMGPVSQLHTSAGKIFAGCYALFSGIVFLIGAGVIVAPIVHRALHRFHMDVDE